MRITIRLHSPYDIDLISLLYRDDYDLKHEMQRAIYGYVKQDGTTARVPDEFVEVSYVHKNPHILEVILYDKDRDVIDFYFSLRKPYRNAILKNLFRFMMEHPYFIPNDKSGADERDVDEYSNVKVSKRHKASHKNISNKTDASQQFNNDNLQSLHQPESNVADDVEPNESMPDNTAVDDTEDPVGMLMELF